MEKAYVFVTQQITEESLAIIDKVAYVSMYTGPSPCPRDRLLDEVQKADALFVTISDQIDAQVFEASTQLKIVANMAVGYDHIDIIKAKQMGIMVSNTPDVLTDATADLTFALMMATARRIVESSDYLRQGHWKSWSPMLLTGQDVYGATMGILGMGRIGQAVARRAVAFNMNVLYYNRRPNKEAEQQLGVQYREMDQLLQEADFIIVLTPLTPETKHLIGKKQFELMKKSAVFINTSRGPVVDEDALLHALKSKQIWAAGLDVYEEEPISNDHPLLELDNVTCLPHIGSASIATRVVMANLACQNIAAALTGKQPPTLIP